MKKQLIGLIAFFCFCTNLSYAAIIDNGTFTTDTESGLDWLDLTFTDGMTISDVVSGVGGWIYDWRYATSEEVSDLYLHFGWDGVLKPWLYNPELFDEAKNYVTTLGATYYCGAGGHYWYANGVYAPSSGSTNYGLSNVEYREGATGPGFYLSDGGMFGKWDDETSSLIMPSLYGHLLVRDSAAPVPEPATFILLGSGLAGLAFYRRKRK